MATNRWRITDYGQKNDPTPDKFTRQGLGSWGKLTSAALAVSPDIERAFRSAGIAPKGGVLIRIHNGPALWCRWEDRTSRRLTGRFDLYTPRGPSLWRDWTVKAFHRADTLPEGRRIAAQLGEKFVLFAGQVARE